MKLSKGQNTDRSFGNYFQSGLQSLLWNVKGHKLIEVELPSTYSTFNRAVHEVPERDSSRELRLICIVDMIIIL